MVNVTVGVSDLYNRKKAAHLYGLPKLSQCRLVGLHGDRVRADDITVTLVNNSGDPEDLAVVQY